MVMGVYYSVMVASLSTTSGILNIITGIFVETAMEKAKSDKSLARDEERRRNIDAMTQLVELFKEVDVSKDEKITMEEWVDFSGSPDAAACLELLGLDVSRAREIFRLVDFDGNGEVEIEEFVVGCTELAGSAKVLDIESLMVTLRNLLFKTFDRIDGVAQYIMLDVANETQGKSPLAGSNGAHQAASSQESACKGRVLHPVHLDDEDVVNEL